MPSSGILKALQSIDSGIAAVSSDTYASLLRGCTNLSDAALVHAHISNNGWIRKTFVANLAIQIYGTVGGAADALHVFSTMPVRNHYSWNIALEAQRRHQELEYARDLFQKMPRHDTVSWNLMLGAYAQAGHLAVARHLFDAMPCRSSVSWNSITQAYIDHGLLDHANYLFDKSPRKNVVSWNALVQAYAETGHLRRACTLFDRMPMADIISWTTIVTAHVAHGQLREARAFFRAMPEKGHVAWNAMVQASFQEGDVAAAAALFVAMPRDCSSWTSMISGYGRSDRIDAAAAAFARMPAWNAVSWNAMAVAAVESGDWAQAKALFDRNPGKNIVSWNAMVQCAANHGGDSSAMGAFDLMPAWDVISFTTVVAAMAAGADVDGARALFDAMPERNLVSWNAMMAGYAQNGDPSSAMALLKTMDLEGIRPNAISFVVALDSCANLAALADGIALLAEITLQGSQLHDRSRNLSHGNDRSQISVDELHQGLRNDPVELSAMDSNDRGENPARSSEMSTDLSTNPVKSADPRKNRRPVDDREHILWQQSIELGNAAINLFGKCGQLDQARRIFESWRRNHRQCRGEGVAWNTMIAAYAHSGRGVDAIDLFAAMNLEGVESDSVTLLSVLDAASSGDSLTAASIEFFRAIAGDYGSIHTREQFLCMADALGRSGKLAEALEVILAMPYAPNLIAWTTLLSACKSHGGVEIGEEVAIRASEMWPGSPAPYIAISSIWRSATGRGREMEEGSFVQAF